MKKPLILFSLFYILFISRGASQTVESPAKILDFKTGYKILFEKALTLDEVITYMDLKILKDNNLIYSDSLSEYEIKNNYPTLRQIIDKTEILLYLNDRPSKDKLKMLIFKDNILVKDDLLPLFSMEPRDINNDGTPELVGVMNYYEMFGENNELMPYNPLLVYQYGKNGITLDSLQTEKINIKIYGKFYGYNYDENKSFKGNEKFEKEYSKYIK